MRNTHIVVIGATGVAGSAFVKYLGDHADQFSGFRVTAVSRRAPVDVSSLAARLPLLTYLQADLLDDFDQLSVIKDATHLVFAGFVPAQDFASQVEPNKAILLNCLQALDRCPIERVLLIQGMKYYGSHLGPFKTPAREDDPRVEGPNYYYDQQDLLEQSGLDWVCLRPHVICGTDSIGTPQNILSVIGVYAALLKAQGRPLVWPGTQESFCAINQATDANLLAQAIAYFLFHDDCRNEAFNITNGDFFRWQHLWPKLADVFNIEAGGVATEDLSVSMPPLASIWDDIVRKYNLKLLDMGSITHWPFADYILRTGWDVMASTVKARQYGFTPCMDTELMYIDHLRTLQRLAILPP